jgi:hypothetical protein
MTKKKTDLGLTFLCSFFSYHSYYSRNQTYLGHDEQLSLPFSLNKGMREYKLVRLSLSVEFASHSTMFFSYNRATNNIFCHGLVFILEENN